jgi:hypothetical protein
MTKTNKLIWIAVVGLVAICLASCSTPAQLYQQGIKKIEKAIEKDPSIKLPADTITTIQLDTLTEYDTVTNEVIKTVTKTITNNINDCKYDELKTASRRELRYLRRMSSDSLKNNRKMYRLGTKRIRDSLSYLKQQNRQLTKQLQDANQRAEKLAKEETKQKKGSWFTRQMGKIWWLLIIISLVAGFILRGYLPSISGIFKSKGS